MPLFRELPAHLIDAVRAKRSAILSAAAFIDR